MEEEKQKNDMLKYPFKPFRFFGINIFFKKDRDGEDPDPLKERKHQNILEYIPA
jgi:hypothetical protein